jgi:O-succinylbenzoate synthase
MRVRLWRQDAQIRHPVSAAQQRHDHRSRLFLEIEFDGATGYGEVAPQPYALNGDPGIDEVLDEVRAFVIPQLRQIVEREGDLPSWSRVGRFAGPRAASNTAVALVEMALLERELHGSGRSIEEIWTPVVETPLQATVSLLGDEPWEVAGDVVRLRVKTEPGTPSRRALERLAALQIPVLLDFNCSASRDTEVIEQVRVISDVATVSGVEQPFAPGNVIEHARLAEQLGVALSIDEGVRSRRDLDQLVRYRAASLICVKPARVGGLANARTLIARAQESGLRPYIGGFFESPYARRVHRALARQGVSEPSDLVPVAVELVGYTSEVDPVADAFGLRPSVALLEHATPVTLLD